MKNIQHPTSNIEHRTGRTKWLFLLCLFSILYPLSSVLHAGYNPPGGSSGTSGGITSEIDPITSTSKVSVATFDSTNANFESRINLKLPITGTNALASTNFVLSVAAGKAATNAPMSGLNNDAGFIKSGDTFDVSGGTNFPATLATTNQLVGIFTSYKPLTNGQAITQSNVGQLLIINGASTNTLPAANTVTGIIGVVVQTVSETLTDDIAYTFDSGGEGSGNAQINDNDLNSNQGYATAAVPPDRHLMFTLASAKNIRRVRDYSYNFNHRLASWKFYGSNLGTPSRTNDNDWSFIGNGVGNAGDTGWKTNLFDHATSYKHYRITITQVSTPGNVVTIRELEIDEGGVPATSRINMAGGNENVDDLPYYTTSTERTSLLFYSDGLNGWQRINIDPYGKKNLDANELVTGTINPGRLPGSNTIPFITVATNFPIDVWVTNESRQTSYSFDALLNPTAILDSGLSVFLAGTGYTNGGRKAYFPLGVAFTGISTPVYFDWNVGERLLITNIGTSAATVTNGLWNKF